MNGQLMNAWLNYKYEGDMEDMEYEHKLVCKQLLESEIKYEKLWEEDWNNLYD